MHPTASQAVCLMADAAVRAGWVEQEDRDYCVNQLLALMALDAPEQAVGTPPKTRPTSCIRMRCRAGWFSPATTRAAGL